MIRIYAKNLREECMCMTDVQRQQMLSLLCVSRREKVKKIKIKEKRDKALVSNVFLQEMLIKYCQEQKVEITSPLEFSYGKAGKPYLKEVDFVHFNLSHSGNWIVVAISDREIGIDIEKKQGKEKSQRVAERFFFDEEIKELSQLSEAEYDENFVRYWTAKEAYLKYLGVGITKLKEAQVNRKANRMTQDEKVSLHYFVLDEEYIGCICAQEIFTGNIEVYSKDEK